MPEGRVGDAAFDLRGDREGRIHEDDAREQPGVEMVMDVGGVKPGDDRGRKEMTEKVSAGFAQFIKRHFGTSKLSEDGKQSGPG
ncbi:hypothetical protein HMP09_1215 [Sphingomonas sp. HMP9]|nr:hypothetical protein HMP09_1215 [Sphingomonas sp. HMP9]